MNLNEIFESYSNKMVQITLYQRAMKGLTQKELEKIYEYGKALEKKPELKEYSHSFHNMEFRRAKDGDHIFYGQKKLSIEDRQLSVTLHKNKQYQWLLAEAYEEFEDCIERLYAYIGYCDNNFWPLRDFGSICLQDINKKPFEWFEEQASNKKDAPSSIINKFRNSFDELKSTEINNALGVNLHLAITLIEFLRHIIVHRGGVVSDKDKFKERILKKCGLYNSGQPSQDNVYFIEQFFGSGNYKNTIILLEIQTNPEIPLDTHINVFNQVSGWLMAYVHIIYECIESHNK